MWGLLFLASHCCDFSCCRVQIIDSQTSVCGSQALELRLSSCGTRAYLLFGMWDLPTPGIKPKSPLLAGKFLSTMPPGKSTLSFSGSLCTNNQENGFKKNTFKASCSAFFLTTICLRVKVKWPQLLRSHLPPFLSAHSTPPTLALCCFSEVKHILASRFFHLLFPLTSFFVCLVAFLSSDSIIYLTCLLLKWTIFISGRTWGLPSSCEIHEASNSDADLFILYPESLEGCSIHKHRAVLN